MSKELEFLTDLARELRVMGVGGVSNINGGDAVEFLGNLSANLRAEFPDIAGPMGTPLDVLGAVAGPFDYAYWLNLDGELWAAPLMMDNTAEATEDASMPAAEFCEPLTAEQELSLRRILMLKAAAARQAEVAIAEELLSAAANVLQLEVSGELNIRPKTFADQRFQELAAAVAKARAAAGTAPKPAVVTSDVPAMLPAPEAAAKAVVDAAKAVIDAEESGDLESHTEHGSATLIALGEALDACAGLYIASLPVSVYTTQGGDRDERLRTTD